MGISKETFEEGKKTLENGSLEYDILEFLQNAKKTDEPARNEKEILEALNIAPPKEKRGIMNIVNYIQKTTEVSFALLNLVANGRVVSKAIKIEDKAESVTYYMAKGSEDNPAIIGRIL
jgi:hypothetical protein